MKKNLLFLIVVFGLLFTGCPEDPPEEVEPIYGIWTDVMTYTAFTTYYPSITLDDGYYIRSSIPDSDFNKMNLPNKDKNLWTEKQINEWFTLRDFTKTEADKATSWLIKDVNHGVIFSRSGNTVYMIIK